MPWEKRSQILTSLVTALLSTTAPLSRAMADSVGSVSAVNQAASGILPSGTRLLSLGQDVIFKETIKTSGAGSAQVAFLDRSTLNVGQNSSVLIDEFVYNPAAGTGSMGLSLSKGVLRFVGGQISHTTGVTIATPVATVGLRGGSATVGIAGPKQRRKGCDGTIFINHIGALNLKNKVDEINITRRGFGVCVVSDDQPFPKPFLIPDDLLQAYIGSTGSHGDQHGGATEPPTDEMTARAGFDFPRLDPPGNPPGSNPFDIISVINAGNSAASSDAQGNQGYGSD